MTPTKKTTQIEYPRLVSVETTNRCNAKCPFCPNNALQRNRHRMSDDLFEKVIEDCGQFPLAAIEPFLNGEPFVDPQILPRLELIRNRLSDTKLRIYTNGYALKPKTIDALIGLGIDHLYVSLNTLNHDTYRSIMGLELERTLKNMDYLTDIARRDKVARKITFRMTRTESTPFSEQQEFEAFCKKRGVRPFIVGLFNYKGEISSHLPVPNFPCEHITRLDVLSNGIVTLCCMDQEGDYAWGDAAKDSILDIYNGPEATRYRRMHRTGKRVAAEPCGECNVFWPSLEKMPPIPTIKFAVQAGMYFLRYRPSSKKRPTSTGN
ncbi:MAG: radical SAM protein [Proteobacteria bacterium]|nr:radical SAM protein [Pseudomonadota bacterium]